MYFWMLLLLPLAVYTGPLGDTETELKPSEDFVQVHSQSGQSPPIFSLLLIAKGGVLVGVPVYTAVGVLIKSTAYL